MVEETRQEDNPHWLQTNTIAIKKKHNNPCSSE